METRESRIVQLEKLLAELKEIVPVFDDERRFLADKIRETEARLAALR